VSNIILNSASTNKLIINALSPNKLLLIPSSSIMDSAVAWYDASVPSSFTLDINDKVEIWHDLSPNGYDVTGITESRRPLYESVNNRVNFHSAASEGLLNSLYPNLSQPLTTVGVFESKRASINQIITYGAGYRQCGTWLASNNRFYMQIANVVITKDIGGVYNWVPNKKYIIIYKWNGASSRVYINAIGGYANPGATGIIGLRLGYGHYGDYLDGYIHEAAVFDWFLSSEEEQEVTDILQVKWDVTLP